MPRRRAARSPSSPAPSRTCGPGDDRSPRVPRGQARGCVGGIRFNGSMTESLAAFSPATRAWFSESFAEPTTVQTGAWQAIARGEHALVVAPTGSGKTLAAFLWAIDRLHASGADAATTG